MRAAEGSVALRASTLHCAPPGARGVGVGLLMFSWDADPLLERLTAPVPDSGRNIGSSCIRDLPLVPHACGRHRLDPAVVRRASGRARAATATVKSPAIKTRPIRVAVRLRAGEAIAVRRDCGGRREPLPVWYRGLPCGIWKCASWRSQAAIDAPVLIRVSRGRGGVGLRSTRGNASGVILPRGVAGQDRLRLSSRQARLGRRPPRSAAAALCPFVEGALVRSSASSTGFRPSSTRRHPVRIIDGEIRVRADPVHLGPPRYATT